MSHKRRLPIVRWSLWALMSNQEPWERGVLHAHWMHNVPTQKVRERLERARSRRRGVLALLWPPRRKYLDGLVWGLVREIDRRDDGQERKP